MLPKEKQFLPYETLGIAWGLAWRLIVVGIPLFFVSKLLPHDIASPFLNMVTSLVDLVANLGAFWLAVHWLFRNGRFGSNKIILMEQADYQQLSNQLASNPQLNPDAPKSGAPVS
jgi:hypothetical protein